MRIGSSYLANTKGAATTNTCATINMSDGTSPAGWRSTADAAHACVPKHSSILPQSCWATMPTLLTGSQCGWQRLVQTHPCHQQLNTLTAKQGEVPSTTSKSW